MNAKARKQAELWAHTTEYKSRLATAQRIVTEALATTPDWYVALSGGKDSTCVLALVREQGQEVPAVFSDDEWNLPETVTYIEGVPNCARIAANVRHTDFFASWADGQPKDGVTQWVDTAHNDGLQTFARQQGYTGAFIGLRAAENARRRVHLRTRGPLFYCHAAQVWQCNPLAWWRTSDVWAYIVTHDLPYNLAYDRLAALGVPADRQRVGPLASERALGYGQMSLLRAGWPDLYNRFAERYPEVRSYV